MEYRIVRSDELCHYGVKGMKWGVRKSVYKSMNRQQRKETRKKYYKTPEGKITRATQIGTILGGPLVGVVAGSITAKKVNKISPKNIEKGRKQIEKVKNNKIETDKHKLSRSMGEDNNNETDEQKITRLMSEGKINPKAHHYFDQNGNLFAVMWDD